MNVNIDLNLPKLHPKQQSVWNSKAKIKVLSCGRQSGKSYLAKCIALRYMVEGKKVAYFCHKFDLSKTFYNELLTHIPQSLVKRQNSSSLSIELITGGKIQFYSGIATDTIRGNTLNLVLVDEAAFYPNLEESYNEHISPTLARYNGDIIFLSSPRGRGYFHSLYTKGVEGEPNYQSWHFTCYDNPHLSAEYIEQKRKELPKAVFAQEYLAEEMANADNPFGTDNINANIAELSKNPAICYGIDIARGKGENGDWTVIIGVDKDNHVSYLDRFQAPYWQIKDKIARLPANVLKILDSTGIGDPIEEELVMTVSNLQGFKFTATSKPQLMIELIKDVEQGSIKYPLSVAGEMHNFQYTYSSTGHIKYAAAKNFKDDQIMALALANKFKKDAIATSNWRLYTA
ncbi:terminase large subunit domain-containing protein [Mucilaginibacter ginsenosidivorax]|uniref:Uncharacterized protein n=1 Tax=Mucilaginibacter ginsenosidivorax TaxID=862126 RepID=A0A5B8W5P6_9SPHI|nr:terminase family protein [Mucilaginibacter ginsenosidivorax]QEC78757.1 hypothetical protein FSB76_23435 [Mucilaginibacter ginsenosidivorax]